MVRILKPEPVLPWHGRGLCLPAHVNHRSKKIA
jgi:hypothetical protein